MNDSELLDQAALAMRAAGVRMSKDLSTGSHYYLDGDDADVAHGGGHLMPWTPLEVDFQAKKMCAALGIWIFSAPGLVTASVGEEPSCMFAVSPEDEIGKIVRRAAVIAAAGIGRSRQNPETHGAPA